MVRYLVDGLRHDGVEDCYVSSPYLIQMVAFSVRHSSFSKSRGESCPHHLTMDLGQLPIQVSSDDYLGLRILPNDALH